MGRRSCVYSPELPVEIADKVFLFHDGQGGLVKTLDVKMEGNSEKDLRFAMIAPHKPGVYRFAFHVTDKSSCKKNVCDELVLPVKIIVVENK